MSWSRRRPAASSRGYGYAHRKLREATIDRAYGTPCVRCGNTLRRGQRLELDHRDDRMGYNGFAHRECNQRAAAQKARGLQLSPAPRPTTNWAAPRV